jgi:tetratricopeptide (TPR) repeat protein
MQKYNLAIKDYSKAIELHPKDADAHYFRGLAYSNLERHKEAIVDYTQVINLTIDLSDIGHVYDNRAISYFELGELELALADLQKALELQNLSKEEEDEIKSIIKSIKQELQKGE